MGLEPAVQSPVCPRVWGSGCSRVEHRLFGAFLVVTHKYKSSSFGGWAVERGGGPGGCLTRCWVLKDRTTHAGPGVDPGLWCVPAGFFWSWAPPIMRASLVWGVGCRLYFENFTVDASIFVVSSF